MRVIAGGVHRRHDFVDGGVAAADAVVEDEDVAGAGAVRFDPVGVVLLVELLVASGAAVVLRRIAPAVEDVAAFVVASAGVAGGLRGGESGGQ